MKKTRITEAEILRAIRMDGFRALEEVDVVVLEANESFSVIRADRDRPGDGAGRRGGIQVPAACGSAMSDSPTT